MIAENTRSTALLGSRASDDIGELAKLVDDIAGRWADRQHGGEPELTRFDDALWRTLDESGLTALTSTPGLGAGPTELAVVLHGLARRSASVPVAESDLLATWLASKAGFEPSGRPLTVAIAETVCLDRGVTGTATDVPWGSEVPSIVLATCGRDLAQVAVVSADEFDIRHGRNLAGESRDRLHFNLDAAQFVSVEPALLDELRVRGAWARCVQTVGALDRAAELTMTHTRERVQFGRPLSKFQAVQHALARMAGEVERSRAAVVLAIAAAADNEFASEKTRFAVCVAKVTVAEAVRTVNTIAHQLHGAIGVTIEHELWRSTLRAQSWVRDYGGPEHYARALGVMVLEAEDPWALLVSGSRSEGQVRDPALRKTQSDGQLPA